MNEKMKYQLPIHVQGEIHYKRFTTDHPEETMKLLRDYFDRNVFDIVDGVVMLPMISMCGTDPKVQEWLSKNHGADTGTDSEVTE